MKKLVIAAFCLILFVQMSQATSNRPDKNGWKDLANFVFSSNTVISSELYSSEPNISEVSIPLISCEEAGVHSPEFAPDGLPYCMCLFGEWFCRPAASPFIEICDQCLTANCDQGNVCDCLSGTCVPAGNIPPE